jgi:cation diffusion facilitator CzcD-associated flavoprotein CzcO
MATRAGANGDTVDTVIVGASVAGLATAACLRRAGVPFVLLEQGPCLAPPWRRHYDRLHLHTSRALSGLPHLGFPRTFPRSPSRDQVVMYLEAYAAHFDLRPRFGTRVARVARSEAGWEVIADDGFVHHARHVVIATGHAYTPNLPDWPGRASFGGPIVHSSAYRNAAALLGASGRDKNVLVVGIGNSGAEIALDLAEQGARVAIAVRSGVNVVPRTFLGISIDRLAVSISRLPVRLGDAIVRLLSRVVFGSLARFGLRPADHGTVTGFRQRSVSPIIDVGAMARIRTGAIAVVPAVTRFSPGQVHFADGHTRPADAVVLATGYRVALGGLLAATPAAAALDDEGSIQAANRAALPFVAGAPGLYLCGFKVNLTGMFRRIAHEARVIAAAISSDRSARS